MSSRSALSSSSASVASVAPYLQDRQASVNDQKMRRWGGGGGGGDMIGNDAGEADITRVWFIRFSRSAERDSHSPGSTPWRRRGSWVWRVAEMWMQWPSPVAVASLPASFLDAGEQSLSAKKVEQCGFIGFCLLDG